VRLATFHYVILTWILHDLAGTTTSLLTTWALFFSLE
jgi:hypothetical protein